MYPGCRSVIYSFGKRYCGIAHISSKYFGAVKAYFLSQPLFFLSAVSYRVAPFRVLGTIASAQLTFSEIA